jgi:MFS family permease
MSKFSLQTSAQINKSSPSAAAVTRLISPQTVMLAGLCAMYMITYIDRVNISTAAPVLRKDLALSETELGLVFSAFAVPYGFLQPLGGWLGDRFGPRWVLFAVGALWAVATIGTGFANGLITLFVARFLLGLGEGATFPTATKAMAIWLPARKRAFAQGITHSFSRLGNAITPPLVGYLMIAYGWRMPFYLLGAISLVWAVWWVAFFRDNPRDDRRLTAEELAELLPPSEPRPVPWGPLFKKIAPVTAVDFCYGWTLWVYLTWLPSFLATAYHLPVKKFVWFTAGVLLAGVIGDTVGGLLSDTLLVRTGNLKFARRFNLVVGLLGSLLFLLPTLFIHDLITVSILLSLAFFFLELCNSVLWALSMDMAPQYAGTAGGMMNLGFGIAGVLSPSVFGFLIDRTGSWQVPFATSVLLLFVGVLLVFRIDPTHPLEVPSRGK